MSRSTKALNEHLERYRQIQLSVTGRKSGRTISNPVWFVVEGDTLFLLPVAGSDTQWYKNVLHNPRIRIAGRGEEGDLLVAPRTDAESLQAVADKFRSKYGAADVKKYYSKFDVAIRAKLEPRRQTKSSLDLTKEKNTI